MGQDKYDLLDRERGGLDLCPGAISKTNVVFLKVQGLELDVKHIKVGLQQFHDLKGVTYDCHQSNNPKKDPEDNYGMVGWPNVGCRMRSCLEFGPSLLVLACFSDFTLTELPSEQVGPICQGHNFLSCLNCLKKT